MDRLNHGAGNDRTTVVYNWGRLNGKITGSAYRLSSTIKGRDRSEGDVCEPRTPVARIPSRTMVPSVSGMGLSSKNHPL